MYEKKDRYFLVCRGATMRSRTTLKFSQDRFCLELTPGIQRLITERNKFRILWQRTRDTWAKGKYNRLTRAVQEEVKALCDLRWRRKLESLS